MERLQKRIGQLEEELVANKEIKQQMQTMFEERVSGLTREVDELREKLLIVTSQTAAATATTVAATGTRRGTATITPRRPPSQPASVVVQEMVTPGAEDGESIALQERVARLESALTASTDDMQRLAKVSEAARADAERVLDETRAKLDEANESLGRERREHAFAIANAARQIEELSSQLAKTKTKEQQAMSARRQDQIAAASQIDALRMAAATSAASETTVDARLEAATKEVDYLRREACGLYRRIDEMLATDGGDPLKQEQRLHKDDCQERPCVLTRMVMRCEADKIVKQVAEETARIMRIVASLRVQHRGKHPQPTPTASQSHHQQGEKDDDGGCCDQKHVSAVIETAGKRTRDLHAAVAELEVLARAGDDSVVSLAEEVQLLRKENAQLRSELDDLNELLRRSQVDVPFVRGLVLRFLEADDRRAILPYLVDALHMSPEERDRATARVSSMSLSHSVSGLLSKFEKSLR